MMRLRIYFACSLKEDRRLLRQVRRVLFSYGAGPRRQLRRSLFWVR
jgi:hypothetical protein